MMKSSAAHSSILLMLTFALLAAVGYLPSKVSAGAVFEPAKPFFKSPDDYKLVFKGPPSKGGPKPPVVLRSPSGSPFVGSILQLATITIEPCGIIGAHNHPRATEHLVVTKGSVEIGIHFENGATLLVGPVKAGQGAVVPQGSIHFVRNTGCSKAELVAAFDSPNAGAVFAGQALLSFPASYRKSAFKAIQGPAPNLFFSQSCSCKKG